MDADPLIGSLSDNPAGEARLPRHRASNCMSSEFMLAGCSRPGEAHAATESRTRDIAGK
jgi:hypothetical protein